MPLSYAPAAVAIPSAAPRRSSGSPGAADDAALVALVLRIRGGEAAAFDQLYRQTREDVARTLRHLVGPRADLEDLLQETYLRLLKAVHNFRGEAQFRTFLYRVCANVALVHLRWWRRRREDLGAEVPEQATEANPETEASRRQASRLVERALEVLTAKKRVVFVYHELCGMGPEEISEIVGTSPNTVRSRLHHARLEFTEELKRLTTPVLGGAR